MSQLDFAYNERLKSALMGRTIRTDSLPQSHRGKPMWSFWGEELGFTGGDVHRTRAYRVYLDLNEERAICAVDVVVEGELISPCSGYYPEALDEFDYAAVRDWCLERTEGYTP